MSDEYRPVTIARRVPGARRLTSAFRRRRGSLAAVVLLLPLIVFAGPALLRGAFYVHDVQHYFYPYHKLAANLVAQGQLPLWNAYAFSGIPLLGDGQTALFYPPSWLFFILPGAAALNYDVLLQFCTAGLGMYLFVRSLGLARLPAFIAAVAYMFGGFMTARVVHLSILSGAALLPWLFFCVERVLRSGTARWFAAAALAVALQAMAGHPQVPVYSALALGLYALARAVERRVVSGTWRRCYLPLLQLAGIYLLGYALAAVQLAPWVEFAGLSPRAAGASFDFVFGGSTTGGEWLLFLFPYLYGSLAPGPYAAQAMDITTAVKTWEHSAYVGIFPLALALVGLLDLARFPRPTTNDQRPTAENQEPRTKNQEPGMDDDRITQNSTLKTQNFSSIPAHPITPSPHHPITPSHGLPVSLSPGLLVSGSVVGDYARWFSVCFFALLLLLGLAMAAGKYTPLAGLIYAAPVIGKLRDVERAEVLAAFALTVLAAFGMQHLIAAGGRPGERVRRPALLPIAALIVVVPLGVVLLAQQPAVQAALRIQPGDVANLQVWRPSAFVPLLLAFASAELLIWWSYRPVSARARLLAAALVVLDLALYAAPFNPTTDPQLYSREPDVVAFLHRDTTLFRKATFLTYNAPENRAAQETLAVSWGMVYGIADINGFNSLQPRRYTDYLFGPDVGDVSYGYLVNEQLLQPESPVLSALNVKYLLVPSGVQPRLGGTFRQVYANDEVRVYENAQVYPRAYFVDTVRGETDARAVLRAVTAAGFDGRRLALVESPQPPALPPTTADAPASATITSYAADRIDLATTTSAPRILVLSEMYFPGWHAYVDGAETPIYRTNYLFRGIAVPAGQHAVSFVYRPAPAALGAALSALALLVMGALCLVRRIERREIYADRRDA